MLASGGSRIEWTEIPVEVRAGIENQLGAKVIEARNQSAGFSPGLAARCRLSNADRVFIKAVSPAQNPMATRIHRREAEVAGALPDSVAAPRMRDVFDDGTWVALVFDDVEGRQPAEPWTQDDLDPVLPAVRAFSAFVDLVFLLPSIGLGGGPDPATIVQKYGLFEDIDTDTVLAVTAVVAGFFQRSALDPPPQGLPNLRASNALQPKLRTGG